MIAIRVHRWAISRAFCQHAANNNMATTRGFKRTKCCSAPFILALKERKKCRRNSQLAAWKESGDPWAPLSMWFNDDVRLAIPIVFFSNDCLVLEGDELDLTWSEQ